MLAWLHRRGATALLCAASLWLAVVLGVAVARTVFVEQDAAHYCALAERCLRGEGMTTLCDRRGPVGEPVALPAPPRAATLWPYALVAAGSATGEVRYTGSLLALAALIGALWLGTAAVRRGTGAPPAIAAFCVVAALLTREACEVATLPLTDAPSLCLTAAALLALTAGGGRAAVLLALAAGAVRFQNAALALPLTEVLPAARRGRARLLAIAAGAAAVAATAGLEALQGLAVFVDPTQRDSLFRAVRWLSLPMLVGLWHARRCPGAAPFWLLGLGHLLVLLAHRDPSDARVWLFANRHGLPFHLVAAALAALALARTRGWPRLVLALMVCIAFGENVARPFKVMRGTHERTYRPELALALDHLRAHPLPRTAVVLSLDGDVLARELGIAGVHLRGHAPDPPRAGEPLLLRYAVARGITHVLLYWWPHRHLEQRNAWMDGLEASLAPHCAVAAELAAPACGARALLLRLPRRSHDRPR